MAEKTVKVIKYPKETIVGLEKNRNIVDVVNAVLEEGKEYTIAEADNLIEKFMKGKVK